MNRRKNGRGRGARVRSRVPTAVVSVPRVVRTKIPPTITRNLRTTILSTINNAASLGANSTFSPFSLAAFNVSSIIAGLSREWSNATGQNGRYLNARLKKLKVTGAMVNKDAFPVRVVVLMSANTPTNNTLTTQATQLPFVDSSPSTSTETLSEVGGQNRWDFELLTSLKQMFGVKNVRGLADPFTNSWDSNADAGVPAVEGISFLMFVLSAVNMVNGVFTNLTFEMTIEFFGLNPDIVS
jgi:hypothetical protein